MKKYIIKRLLIAIPTLIGITLIDYAIMCFAGSPLEMLQGARISQEAVAAKEAALGLDKPFYGWDRFLREIWVFPSRPTSP